MARSRTQLLETLGELDADERAELVAAMAAAAEAEQAADDADGAAETRAAEAAAAEAQAELDTAFEDAGLSPEQGRALMLVVDRAATANTEAAVRRVLDEYVIEGDDGGDPPAGDPPAGDPPTDPPAPRRRRKKKATALADLVDDPNAEPAADPPPDVKPEPPPEKTHWFHKPIVRGEKS